MAPGRVTINPATVLTLHNVTVGALAANDFLRQSINDHAGAGRCWTTVQWSMVLFLDRAYP